MATPVTGDLVLLATGSPGHAGLYAVVGQSGTTVTCVDVDDSSGGSGSAITVPLSRVKSRYAAS